MKLWEIITGEALLTGPKRRGNGGAIVFVRAIWVSSLLYSLVLAGRALIDPSTTMQFSFSAFRKLLFDTMPWFGAMFAGVYATLYARFSSQWGYLANLYNQIKAAELGAADTEKGRELAATWKAGFIEDADDLHLAAKPLFASVIKEWSKQPGIAEAFAEYSVGGAERFAAITAAAIAATHKHLRALPEAPRDGK